MVERDRVSAVSPSCSFPREPGARIGAPLDARERTSTTALPTPRGQPNEDRALVEAMIAGDRTAEEQLYRRHAPSVLVLATRLLRSHDEAMDVLQDAFVSAFEDIRELRDLDAFRPWIHRIAVRLVHRRWRRRRLLALLGLHRRTDQVSLEDLADERASPEARVELRWLDAVLLSLDVRARLAWMLRNIDVLGTDGRTRVGFEGCDGSVRASYAA